MKIPHQFFFGLLAFILFVCYVRQSSIDNRDEYRCTSILTDGHWLDPAKPSQTSRFKQWQPNGCTMRTYNSEQTATCLHPPDAHDAVFIGDSTVREMFWAMARTLDKRKAVNEEAAVSQKHGNLNFEAHSTKLSFIWDPLLNSTDLPKYIRSTKAVLDSRDQVERLPNRRALLVVGAGMWFSKEFKKEPVEAFKSAIDRVAKPATADHTSRYNVGDLIPGINNRLYLMPVQEPYYQNLDLEHKAFLNRQKIDEMNDYMRGLSDMYDVNVLLSFLELGGGFAETHQANGLHVSHDVSDRMAQVLLNAKCNNDFREYPYTATCCYAYERSWSQFLFQLSGIVGFLALAWAELQTWAGIKPNDVALKNLSLLKSLLSFWTMLTYCYLADRTHLFEKVSKHYSDFDFAVFSVVIGWAGLLTIKQSSPGKTAEKRADQQFLSRDQSDEWKGWMQAAILAYHYTGASSVLGIYKVIRLMVASYLFMTGYGHASYFHSKGDFSFKRLFTVNLRINLLSVVLPWVMDADYLFYYFAPLVTYWYGVIFAVMYLKSNWNQNLNLFMLKLSLAMVVTTFIHRQEWIWKPIFSLINKVFGSQWEAREWLFRVSLDEYIVYVGIVVAVLYQRASKPDCQDFFATMNSRTRSILFNVTSILFVIIYIAAASTQTTKASSNKLHTYISPLAVLAFIQLRNCTRSLRNYYSSAYAWLGRISLETFVLQYHIWLAADTKGLLSLGLFGNGNSISDTTIKHDVLGGYMGIGRMMDCIILGIVFMWVSLRTSDATNELTSALAQRFLGNLQNK